MYPVEQPAQHAEQPRPGERHRRRCALPAGPRPDLDALGPTRLQRHRQPTWPAPGIQLHREARRRSGARSSRKWTFGDSEIFQRLIELRRRREDVRPGSTTTRWASSPPPRPRAYAPTTRVASRATWARRSTSAPPSPAPSARTSRTPPCRCGRRLTVLPGGHPGRRRTGTAGAPRATALANAPRSPIGGRGSTPAAGPTTHDPGFFVADGFLPADGGLMDRCGACTLATPGNR